MPTMLKNPMNRVDNSKWYPSSTSGGSALSLPDLIAATVTDPACAHRYFSRPCGFGSPESFCDFMTDFWYYPYESEECSFDDAFDLAAESERAARGLHTTGWQSGKMGLTMDDVKNACREAGVAIGDLRDALREARRLQAV